MIASCGCHNQIDVVSGVLKSVSKCKAHLAKQRSKVEDLPLEYYTREGKLLENGIPQNHRHISELIGALAQMNILLHRSYTEAVMYDVGAGLGSYAPLFLRLGYNYNAVEPCRMAARWIKEVYYVSVCERRFEDAPLVEGSAGHVHMAHSLEHMADAPAALRKALLLLRSEGTITVVVPNGEDDPGNPDHLWFFTPETLTTLMRAVGFRDVRTCQQQIVPKERFIYAYGIV